MMLKALPLVHFWNVLLLKEQMMTSLRKICLENNHRFFFWPFFSDSFLVKFAPKTPAKFGQFSSNLSLKIPRKMGLFLPWPIRSPYKFIFGTHDYWIYYANIDLCHQHGISVTESQTFLCTERPSGEERGETDVFAGESWLCGLQIETFMETTISLMKNTPLWWLWNFKILWGSPVPDPTKKKGVTFRVKVCVGFTIAPVTINLNINHNYNKILKSDWLSTVLISALIGQCDRRVRIMP